MRRLLSLLAVSLIALVHIPVAGAQDTKSEVETRIAELADLIRGQEGKQSQIQTEITAAEHRMREIRARLAEARAALEAIEAQIADTEATSERLQASIDLLQRHLAETRIELLTTRDDLRDLAVELYVRGSTEMPGLVFDLDEVADVAIGLSYARGTVTNVEVTVRVLETLKKQEQDQQAELTSQQEEAQAQLAVLEDQREEAAGEEAKVLGLRAEVDGELSRQRTLLARVEAQIAEYENEKQLATEELARLEQEIRSRSTEGGASEGRLGWPINAPVSSHFGPRVHPILGSVRLHAGIDLRAGAGTPIRAAGSGRVIMAGVFGGYGNTTVIDHGGGLTTLYAHQSSFAISAGDRVERGAVIGYVGSTGFSTGAHLHFETRERGIPVDPMGYLG